MLYVLLKIIILCPHMCDGRARMTEPRVWVTEVEHRALLAVSSRTAVRTLHPYASSEASIGELGYVDARNVSHSGDQ